MGKKPVAILFFFAYVVFSCYGQSYLVHHYSGIDGLPSVIVYDVTQDHWGRIWFATRSGISCYDGVSWKNYTLSDGLPVLSFLKIAVDQKGRIWAVGDPAQGALHVAFHDGNQWNSLHALELEIKFRQPHEITSFQLIEQKGENKPVILVGSMHSGVFRWKDEKWTKLTEKNGLLSNSVNGITILKEKCYLATDNGLTVLKNGDTIDNRWYRSLNLPSKEIKGICAEYKDKFPDSPLKDSRIWLYGHRWLGYFYENDSSSKIVLFDTGVSFKEKKEAARLLPDYRSGIYFGSPMEIYYFNYKTKTSEPFNIEQGLISEGTNSMFIDFEKNIWIACRRGVSKISSRRFSNFQRINGLLEDEVTAVMEYEPGKFVLGHNKGFTFWDGSKFSILHFSRADESLLPICRTLDMKLDSKQNIWAALSWAGLAKIDKQKNIKWYGKGHGLPDAMVTSLWIDKGNPDRIWVGTDEGIFLMTGDRFVLIPVHKSFTPIVRKIYMTKRKVLLLGTDNTGIYAHEQALNRWKNYRLPGENRGNNIYAITEDHRGRLLIGTLDGAFILETKQGTLKKFKEKGFDITRPVYFIVEDHRHRLWFGLDNGVVRWDGVKEVRYSTAEGLIGQETNRAAGIVDSRGKVWIGTNRGVSVYNESFDSYNRWNPPPKLRLLYMQVDHRRIPLLLDHPIQLSYKTHALVFHFRGISFQDEKNIRFRHKMEGFDKEWLSDHYPYKQMIRYSSVPAGRYRFFLKVRNALGVWSDPVMSPELVILEPFYRRWWFSFLVFLSALLIFFGIFRYVTQQRYAALLEKQVEERTNRLQAVENRYRTLFEESRDVVFVSTPEGKLIDINPAGLDLFGYPSKDEALKVLSTKYLYNNPEDREKFREAIEKDGYVKDYELFLKGKGGERIIVQVTATVVRDNHGKTVAYRGIIRDNTEKKRLEQQLIQAQKMEAIGTLAGGIAHDFNNILGVIMGYSELAIEKLAKGMPMRRDIEYIRTSAKRATELVKQILAFSRQSEREQRPLKLSAIIDEALKLLRPSLPATIKIRKNIRSRSGIVMADPTLIHQIIMNLGTNAAHAMQENGGVLEVSLEDLHLDNESVKKYNEIEAGAYLRLTVKDTGHGIPRQLLKRIFEPYFTTKKPGEGTGMGLAVIHGIIKSLGGDITVSSEPGKGSTFHVLLPRIDDEPEIETLSMREIPGGSGERIMLVDDELLLAMVEKETLEGLGYEVISQSDPIEALEMFRIDPDQFDLVITDLTMPNMTGTQLAKELKRIKHDIPIVICSGFTDSKVKEKMKSLGVNDFVMKPINKRDLAAVVRKALDQREEKY